MRAEQGERQCLDRKAHVLIWVNSIGNHGKIYLYFPILKYNGVNPVRLHVGIRKNVNKH